jgi:hypothetical protein
MNLHRPMFVTVISLCLAPTAFSADTQKHEGHLQVSQLPAAVQSTLQREGGTVKAVEKETEGGQSFFEATLSKGKEHYSLHIADDGTILKREAPEGNEHREKK